MPKIAWMWRVGLVVIAAGGLSSCFLDPQYVPPPRLIQCTDQQVKTGSISGCKTLADQGSGAAAAHLGGYYDLRGETIKAYQWYRKAADLDDIPTLRLLYDAYRIGTKVPRNEVLSHEFLTKAANLKAEWALLLLAKQSEQTDPDGALAAYLGLGRNNNCFAQARLALIYYNGDLAGRNVTQAYFWSLLATAGAAVRKSEYHVATDLFAGVAPTNILQNMVLTCEDVKTIAPKMEAEASLSPERRHLAQDAATRWAPGLIEPQLPGPDGNAVAEPVPLRPMLPVQDPAPYAPPNPDALHGLKAPDTVMIVMGVDGYENAPRASFAERDAATIKNYAVATLGISEDNIKTLIGRGARRLDVEKTLTNWLPGHVKAETSTVILYFAGHGLSSDDGHDLFLLPYDGDRELLEESALRREHLIERIKQTKPRHVILILDTCYSGLNREGDSLFPNQRPLLIIPRASKPHEGVTILSAAQGTQLSLALNAAGHGLFSYMLMKGLEGPADLNGDRQITTGELMSYAQERVSREASKGGHKQNPQLEGNESEILVRW